MTKVAIVSGAAGNLGQAVVKKFIAEGYKVIGTIMPDDPVEIEFIAPEFEAIPVNLIDEENTAQFATSVIKKYGKIDVAVLTVGGFALGNIADTKTVDIARQYRLNFETTYNIAHPVFTQMLNQKNGRIFFIGSRPGLDSRNGKGMIAYSLTKSLLFRLAEVMNDEAHESNVITSVLVPGTIDTIQNRKNMPGVNPSDWVKAEQIANIIHFYCSESAAVIREPVIKAYNNS